MDMYHGCIEQYYSITTCKVEKILVVHACTYVGVYVVCVSQVLKLMGLIVEQIAVRLFFNSYWTINKLDVAYSKTWDHMYKMAAVLQRMSEVMRDMSQSSYLLVKEQVACSCWKYSHINPDKNYSEEPPTLVMEGQEDYKEHFNISGKFELII